VELSQAQTIVIEAINTGMLKGCYDIHQAKSIVTALDTILAQPTIEFGEVTTETK
jgi:hypothetical protein